MKKTENCHHCNTEYIPTRRGVQKFCSKSCKSRYWYLKQNVGRELIPDGSQNIVELQKPASENMSWSGIGNATAGSVLAEGIINVFTPAENKPATKKDVQELMSLLTDRYLKITNLDKDRFGRTPFYDVETGNLVYLSGLA